MGFRIVFENDKLWVAPDAALCTRWQDEEEQETPSLCDLVMERGAYTGVGLPVEKEAALRESNPGTSHHQDFDFDFGRGSLTAYNICPADDLFHEGRLLPLAHFPYSKSNSRLENRLQLIEKVQAWRKDSQPKGYYSTTQDNLQRGNFATPTSDSSTSSVAKQKSKPPTSIRKTDLKWQQLLTPGLIKTPPMKMQDMRLKQGNPNSNRVHNSFLNKEVLIAGEVNRKTVDFEQKTRTVDERPWSRARRSLEHIKSLNSCTSPSNCGMECSTNDNAGGCMDSDPAIFESTAKRPSKWILPKLLFRSIFTIRKHVR